MSLSSVRPIRAARALLPLLVLAVAAPAHAQTIAGQLPLHLFRYDRAAPLELQSSPLEEREGVAVHAISYASPKGGRVNGRLFVPRGSGPFAGVVLAHGMPGNAEAFTGRGVYIARHGAVVVAIDAPFNRRPGGPLLTVTPQDSAEQVQLVVDLQRAVDVLLARPDVDSARLAYVGRSYGGATGALFAGVERRLKTYILAVADGGVTTRFTASGAPRPPGAEEQFRAWIAAMAPIEGIRWVGRANGSILFQNARRDQFVSVERAQALHAAAAGQKEVRWYDTEHALDAAAYVDQLRWLARTIGITPPGPEDEAGPQIPPPPGQPRRQP